MRSLHYLTQLIQFPSVSTDSNVRVTDQVQQWLGELDFELERVDYTDENGVAKSNIVGRKGPAGCGLAYFGHTDVVPVHSWSHAASGPWQPQVTSDKVYGRGSCDMKGSVACMLAAAEATKNETLKAPLYVIATADEEVGMYGARMLVERSKIYREIVANQSRAIIGEPTELDVVHAHKGGRAMTVTSVGRAAHSSTGLGRNANMAMVPFLVGIKQIHDEMESDKRWRDERFSPSSPTMNIVIRDTNNAINITSPKSECIVYFRPMPGQDADEAVDRIRQLAETQSLKFELMFAGSPLFTDPKSHFIQELLPLTDRTASRTVAYGTDGAVFTELKNIVVLGPGSISQAHTDDEWIELDQLQKGTALYERLVRHWCVN